MKPSTATANRIIVPCTFLLAMLVAAQAGAEEEYLKSYTLTGRATVRVKVDDSSVRVVTSDTNQVEFRVTSEGFAAIKIGGKLHVDSQQNGNEVALTVHLSPQVTILLNTKRLSTEVRMPKNADLELDTSDGRVELSNLNGNIVVHTSNGAVNASQLSGSINIRSNDGNIVVDTLTGEFKLESGNGKLNGTALDGKCKSLRATARFTLPADSTPLTSSQRTGLSLPAPSPARRYPPPGASQRRTVQ